MGVSNGMDEMQPKGLAPPIPTVITPFMQLLSQRKEPKMLMAGVKRESGRREEAGAGGYRLEDAVAKNWREIETELRVIQPYKLQMQ